MKNMLIGSIVTASFVVSSGAAAQIPRSSDSRPDLRGYWNPPVREEASSFSVIEEHSGGFGIQAGKSLVVDPPDGRFPYHPWALAEKTRRWRPENAYEDPHGQCILSGIPRIMNFPFEIAYTPGNVVFLFDSGHLTRIVPLNGRPHLPSGIRLWMGDPVGRWEGDTLVIDSTNFNGKFWMDHAGDFMSDQAHVVERITLADANTLKWEETITDPHVFTRPVTMAYPPFERSSVEEIIEDTCHEGNADLVHLKNNYDAAHAGRTP